MLNIERVGLNFDVVVAKATSKSKDSSRGRVTNNSSSRTTSK